MPSVILLGDGEGVAEADADLLGVGFFVVGVGEGFFLFGVGVGLEVFVAPAASLAIPGNRAARTTMKTLREICPIYEMVANQDFTLPRHLKRTDGFGTLGRDCGGSQKSFRLAGLSELVEPFEGLNARNEARV